MQPIAVAGHLCLDIFPSFTEDQAHMLQGLTPGKLIDTGSISFATGGTVSNTGLACVKFGAPTLLMSVLGDDLFGRETLRLVQAHGGRTDGIRVRKDLSSSYTIVIAPPGTDRVFFHHPGSNDRFDASCVNFTAVAGAGLFHFGYPPLMRSMFDDAGSELIRIFKKARETGVVTSLDMALPDPVSPAGLAPWDRILEGVLPSVDLFLPSIEELLYMLDRPCFMKRRRSAGTGNLVDRIKASDASRAAEKALALGAGAVIIKCGHRGLYLRTAPGNRLAAACRKLGLDQKSWAGRELWQPCFHVDRMAGTTGAGDCAIAGFLCACAQGATPDWALRYAAGAGSFNVTRADSLSGLIPWDEMTAVIRKGWATDPFEIKEAGWQYDEEARQWRGPSDKKK